MKRVTVQIVIEVCVVLVIGMGTARGDERETDEVRLPNALDRFVKQELEPAYATANPLVILESLRKQLPRLSTTQIEQIDKLLQVRGLPGVAGMLSEAHLAAILATVNSTEEMGTKEARLAIRYTLDEVERLLGDVRAVRLMKDPLPRPASLREFRDLLWNAYIQQNELLELKDRVRLGQTLTRKYSARNNAAGRPVDILTTDFAPYHRQVEELLQDLDERTLELRVEHVLFAVTTLQGEVDLQLRLAAAGALVTDGEALMQRIKAGQGEFRRDTLNEQVLLDQLAINMKKGEESAGDLMKKSKLLFGGLHWWLRGRYGRGIKFYGLVKADQAKHDPAARNQIYMPTQLPTGDKLQRSSDYDYPDRRHYYGWMWEERTLMVRLVTGSSQLTRSAEKRRPTRQLMTTQQSPTIVKRNDLPPVTLRSGGYTGGISSGGPLRGATKLHAIGLYERSSWTTDELYKRLGYDPPQASKQTKRVTSQSPTSQSPTNQSPTNQSPTSQSPTNHRQTQGQPTYVHTYVPPLDPATIYQLVGFTEFGQALLYFDELIKLCNDQELAAINALIEERDEFMVEVNLSRTMEQKSSLSEQPQDGRDNFQRRGLEWITALARIEVAAMLVGFADRDDAFVRFAGPYDLEAYKELLADGMRSHYWSLHKDPQLNLVLTGRANANRTLAYFRRLQVAQAMLQAAAQLTWQQHTPAQRAELNAWKLDLDKTQVLLAKQIAEFHQP